MGGALFNRTLAAEGWQRGLVHLKANKEFRIIMTGTAGSSYEGDIAIDDISITGCKGITCYQLSFGICLDTNMYSILIFISSLTQV